MGSWKRAIRRVATALGPGLITGAADDDPSGIVTYSQPGAQFGFALTWTYKARPRGFRFDANQYGTWNLNRIFNRNEAAGSSLR